MTATDQPGRDFGTEGCPVIHTADGVVPLAVDDEGRPLWPDNAGPSYYIGFRADEDSDPAMRNAGKR